MGATTLNIVFNTFEQEFDKYIVSKMNFRNICIDIIKDICDRREDKTINLDNLKMYLSDNGGCYPTMAYDGGNHSEYASTMYSEVNGFRIEDGDIIFDIEDSSYYHEDFVMLDDLADLCDMIIKYENEGYKLGVNEYSAE